ncbi:aspartyl protease family protein [Candidatus Woesearchaeota archaeon]|nr:aspartyl protease family protein [Candidatus Woesearchaeota archaeon]
MKGYFQFGNPVIELNVEGRKIAMLLDTGFNGNIMLPESTIRELALDQIGISDYLTASGDNKVTEVYKGKIDFLDEKLEVSILSTDADFSLAGMELFHNCRIVVERSKNIVEVVNSK